MSIEDLSDHSFADQKQHYGDTVFRDYTPYIDPMVGNHDTEATYYGSSAEEELAEQDDIEARAYRENRLRRHLVRQSSPPEIAPRHLDTGQPEAVRIQPLPEPSLPELSIQERFRLLGEGLQKTFGPVVTDTEASQNDVASTESVEPMRERVSALPPRRDRMRVAHEIRTWSLTGLVAFGSATGAVAIFTGVVWLIEQVF